VFKALSLQSQKKQTPLEPRKGCAGRLHMSPMRPRSRGRMTAPDPAGAPPEPNAGVAGVPKPLPLAMPKAGVAAAWPNAGVLAAPKVDDPNAGVAGVPPKPPNAGVAGCAAPKPPGAAAAPKVGCARVAEGSSTCQLTASVGCVWAAEQAKRCGKPSCG
jgi:hypothetical protein